MTSLSDDAMNRVHDYCSRQRIVLGERLGHGQDGMVFATNRKSAIKVFHNQNWSRKQYDNEKAVYERLTDLNVTQIAGFSVPRLFEAHDELLVLEMEIVTPPYVVDFAGAYLDEPPDFPDEVMAETLDKRRELYGEDWPLVNRVIFAFQQQLGIYLADIKPGNIMLRGHNTGSAH